MTGTIDPQLAMALLEATEQAAIAAAQWIGKGERKEADAAAVDAMRAVLNRIPMRGTVVIGEGERDEAPMLYIGEEVGTGTGPEVDIAVDPLEGTNLVAKAMPNAWTVLAAAPRGSLLHAPDMYMRKLAVGPAAAEHVHLDDSVTDIILAVANAQGKPVDEVTLITLERPRHDDLVAEARAAGARVRLITDGDVYAAIATALPGTGIDILIDIGAAPEGVLAAAALRCLGGEFYGALYPRSDAESKRAQSMGIDDVTAVRRADELVRSNNVIFVGTGVTNGDLLRGVAHRNGKLRTSSFVTDASSGLVRYVESVRQA